MWGFSRKLKDEQNKWRDKRQAQGGEVEGTEDHAAEAAAESRGSSELGFLGGSRTHKQFRSRWSKNLQRSWSRWQPARGGAWDVILRASDCILEMNPWVLSTERTLTGSSFPKDCSQAAGWNRGGLPPPTGELRAWTGSGGGREQAQTPATGWRRSTTWRWSEWGRGQVQGGWIDDQTPPDIEYTEVEADGPPPLDAGGAFSILHMQSEVPTGNPAENIQKEGAQYVCSLGSKGWATVINRERSAYTGYVLLRRRWPFCCTHYCVPTMQVKQHTWCTAKCSLDELINRKHIKPQELYPGRIDEKTTMRRGHDSREYHHLREKGKKEPTKKPKEGLGSIDSREYGVMDKKGVVGRNKPGMPTQPGVQQVRAETSSAGD